MEEIKKDLKKTVLSVLTTLTFCMCLCFITMKAFINYDGSAAHIVHATICFSCLFIEVMISAFYAARCLRNIYIDWGWKGPEKLPQKSGSYEKLYVAFITKEKCIFNGVYELKSQLFIAYDGMRFRPNEVMAWCDDRRYNYFVRFFSYAPDHEF